MKIDLFRLSYGTKSTPGRLSIDGLAECSTLELPSLDNHPQTSCIPAGIYSVVINFSSAHQKNMPEIVNVPNRDGIRFDIANYPDQLLGCVAVGETSGDDCVNNSATAWLDLYQKIDNALKTGNSATIEIHEPPEA